MLKKLHLILRYRVVKRVKIALKLSIDSGNKFLRLFKDLFLDVWANFKEVEVIVGEHASFM